MSQGHCASVGPTEESTMISRSSVAQMRLRPQLVSVSFRVFIWEPLL